MLRYRSPMDTAAAHALQQVDAVRDQPAARLALLEQTYRGPTGDAPLHLPFRRAAMAFMRWQLERGSSGHGRQPAGQSLVAGGQ